MALQRVKTEAETALEEHFAARTDAGEPEWLAARRRQAFERLAAAGLPNRRVEAWHFTDLRRHMSAAYAPAEREAAEAVPVIAVDEPFGAAEAARVVLVNGYLRPDLTDLDRLPDGVTLQSFGEAARGKDEALEATLGSALSDDGGAIATLNGAFASDGVVIRIAEEAQIKTPLHLMFVNDAGEPVSSHARNLITVGAGARASLIECHLGRGDYQGSAVTEMLIGEGAEIDHVKLQDQSLEAIHLDLMA
ncbi:MAG TPA: SufD family Fe-S cluster assembly protein, partial [Hyphomicrobiales bacterium]|nr:SufD family Fe-S cluster assembly protein [Hyphomicrobiales bacterium]